MERKRFVFQRVAGKHPGATKFWFELSAPRVVACSQYVDLQDENGMLMATFTFTSGYTMKEESPAETFSTGR